MMQVGVVESCTVIAVLFFVSNLWFFFRVLRPLKQLSRQAEQLKHGNFTAFEQPCGGVSEIRQLRRAMAGMVGHVRRSQEQSRAYADRLADAQEGERKRVAHELHDETLQSLIAINQSIDLARTWMYTEPDRAQALLQAARQQAVETVTGLRNIIGGLRPPALEELGLVAALEMEVEKIADLKAHVRVKGITRRLDEARELALFRAAQEALTNARRHSQASQVEITVSYHPEGIRLSVTDNGIGFPIPAYLSDLAAQKHYGLMGIQERTQSLGGTLTVSSKRDQGTTLEIFVPSDQNDQPTALVTDPVCKAQIEPQQAYSQMVYLGVTYFFCCPVCQGAFQKNPELYLTTSPQTVS
jgi:signal transduction histidine kinase/YHS domain-containing protein